LSKIVPTPCASAIVAFVGADRLTVKVSVPSVIVSPRIGTFTVAHRHPPFVRDAVPVVVV